LVAFQLWNEGEQCLRVGPPEPGSTRELELKDSCQQMKNKLQHVIDRRRNGEDQSSIPFIDALLQSGVPDEQVSREHSVHTTSYCVSTVYL